MFKLKMRKKETKRKRPSSLYDEAVQAAVRRTLPVLLTAGILVALVWVFMTTMVSLDYFRVKTIETEGAEGLASFKNVVEDCQRVYRGRSIFAVDLRERARSIISRYPDIKEIHVRKILPDRIMIALNLRRPVALLSDQRYYPVDRDGVLLPNADPSLWQKLPVITGVSVKERERSGANSPTGALKAALDLVAELDRARTLIGYTVTSIDVTDPKNASFFFEGGVEIKIGRESFRERLMKLAQTLKNPKLVLARVKYIDLRFREIVIGQR